MRFAIPVLPPLAVLAAVGFQRACSMASKVNGRLPVVIAGIVLATLVLSSALPEHARTRPPTGGKSGYLMYFASFRSTWSRAQKTATPT
jgi:hypothetical protein